MSASQRNKGKAYEQDIVRRFRELLPGCDVRRGWQSDGREAPDVAAGPFSVECKHRQRPTVKTALADAEAHCARGTIPVAICRWQGGEELVALRWDDFAEIVATYWREVNR